MSNLFKYPALALLGALMGLCAHEFQPKFPQVEALVVPAFLNDRVLESPGITLEKLRSDAFLAKAAKRSGVPVDSIFGTEGDRSYGIEIKPNRGGDAITVKVNASYLTTPDVAFMLDVHLAIIQEIIFQQNSLAYAKLSAAGAEPKKNDESSIYASYFVGRVSYSLVRAHSAYDRTVTYKKILPSKIISILLFISLCFGAEIILSVVMQNRIGKNVTNDIATTDRCI